MKNNKVNAWKLNDCDRNKGISHNSINKHQENITVIIGPADYGIISPQDTTEYQTVNPGDNNVYLNGELSNASPVYFGSGNMETVGYWTYYFNDFGEGHSMDGL